MTTVVLLGYCSEDISQHSEIKNEKSKIGKKGNSLEVRWLGLCTFTAEGPGLTPDLGTKILQAVQHAIKQTNKKNEGGKTVTIPKAIDMHPIDSNKNK